MTRRLVLCEGPDDLNALRAVAQLQRWATSVPGVGAGAGQERVVSLQAGDARVEIKVPSQRRGATGEGKSALARAVAEELQDLRPQVDPEDASRVSLIAAVFDPDGDAASAFHAEVAAALRRYSAAWTVTEAGAPGVWRAAREAGEDVEVRAVHWRAPGGVLDGLPEQANLERLLCAVLAKAYPADDAHVARWLTEIGAARQAAGRKPPTWKAAIHVWLAAVYEKADQDNAASRILHQQDACKPHVVPTLDEVGLLTDLRPLLAP
jgi:hypothetical protein